MKKSINDLRNLVRRISLHNEDSNEKHNNNLPENNQTESPETLPERTNHAVGQRELDAQLPSFDSNISSLKADDSIDAAVDQDELKLHLKHNINQNTCYSIDQSNGCEARQPELEVIHASKLLMTGKLNYYYILGTIQQDMSRLQITLLIQEQATSRKERTKIDLYEREQLLLYSQHIGDLFQQSPIMIESEMLRLTDLLEQYREQELEITQSSFLHKKVTSILAPEKHNACIQFLSEKNLMKRMDEMIEQSGVIGEENTRKLLYVVASTYKMNTPLHVLIQGINGTGKSFLINAIGQCFPPEDVISMSRVTSKSLYHYNQDELVDKLLLFQNYDCLDEQAKLAIWEFQHRGNISTSMTTKDRFGNLTSSVKSVRSHFASLMASSKPEIDNENMCQTILAGMDESEEQNKRIINHQNKSHAGLVDGKRERIAREFLQNCMRCLRPYEVINCYADKIQLPLEAKMLRRLNGYYQALVKQITILHQYQRETDNLGRLKTETEDLIMACEIMFESIILKVDELSPSLRQFFNHLKIQVKLEAAKLNVDDVQFTQRQVRFALRLNKTQCFRYFEELEKLEYIQRMGGFANRGFKYQIVYWDDMENLRDKIKSDLQHQFAQMEAAN